MIQQQTIPAWIYPIILLFLLIVAGVAEYLKMIPTGTFGYTFALVLGLVAPSPIMLAHSHSTDTQGTPTHE